MMNTFFLPFLDCEAAGSFSDSEELLELLDVLGFFAFFDPV